jgi:hypothetical protein
MRITLKRLVKYKVWLDRSRQYVSYVQFGATLYIVAKLLRNSPVKMWIFDHWYLSFPLLFVVFIGGCIVLGYIESLFKIREHEQSNYTQANPEWTRLMEKIDELLKR